LSKEQSQNDEKVKSIIEDKWLLLIIGYVSNEKGLTVSRSVLQHESFIPHHHEGGSIYAGCNFRRFLGGIVSWGRGSRPLIQLVDLLVKMPHVLNAGKIKCR
jgi:hypothetical protein